jgi:predicted phosphohydrolase
MLKRFQIISDIHLEKTRICNIVPHSPNLLIAGDIGNISVSNFNDFFYSVSKQFRKVVFVTGNHDYWGESIDTGNKYFSHLAAKYNITFLNNTGCIIDGYKIFGGTFWSYVCPTRYSIIKSYDNIKIKGFNFDIRNCLHMETLKYLEKMNKVDIILTHYPPINDVIHPDFKNWRYFDTMVNNCPKLRMKCNKWVCGHLHKFSNVPDIIMNPV